MACFHFRDTNFNKISCSFSVKNFISFPLTIELREEELSLPPATLLRVSGTRKLQQHNLRSYKPGWEIRGVREREREMKVKVEDTVAVACNFISVARSATTRPKGNHSHIFQFISRRLITFQQLITFVCHFIHKKQVRSERGYTYDKYKSV